MIEPSRRIRANAIRALAMDAVEQARSGHPGMPMGMADIAEVLWCDFLRHNPANPAWPDRDRFVLSNGHGSMLQYALLHLAGYDLSIEELKRFRQLDSLTPGHPESHLTPGVETTTGPLGQGLANAVGMALAEKLLAARFNRPGFDVVDHYTYAFIGDGCLMEGISHEVASLAGTLGLGKLIVFYDDNGISIDGLVQGWFTDDTPKRFEAYGWHVLREVDGHNAEQIKAAIVSAQAFRDAPTLICCKTTIGYGAPHKQGKESSHGAPLGAAEVAAARQVLAWNHSPFVVPDEIYAAFDARERGEAQERAWRERLQAYRAAFPELGAEFERRMAGHLPDDFDHRAEQLIREFDQAQHSHATRKASQLALHVLADAVPELIGGSADLTHSNLTQHGCSRTISSAEPDGNTLYFGVREFGMTAIANGLYLHGGVIPFVATFLVFSDYARNAVRMSALIPAQTIHVYTHDSIGLGEDGPTHQPVEHLASLRLIPELEVWRPADAVETAVAWVEAVKRRAKPSVLALTRQNVAHQYRDQGAIRAISRGAYVLVDETPGMLRLILIATGSELELTRQAALRLRETHGAVVRVVSMPCVERFAAQPIEYRESVLPTWCGARVVVEAGATGLWHRIAGDRGRIVGLDRFGASAPGDVLMQHLGFTVERVVALGEELLAG